MNASLFYLFAFATEARDESSATVFYKITGQSLAESLCRLFAREYADAEGRPGFHYKAATLISTETQVLLDEALDWLAVYDDPDRGIYDPPPSKNIHLLAQYAVRAKKWEELLIERGESCNENIAPHNSESTDNNSPTMAELREMSYEDQRNSGMILLLLLAQAYYKMLECTICTASWCAALDLDLNQSYFWTVKTIANLLKYDKELKDFPVEFKPLFSDLYPSTIRDVDWEEMVAPDAERFLSTVQQYVHSKGVYDPEEGSPAWVFIELFRPSVNAAIARAIAYDKRMRQYCQRIFGSSSPGAPNVSAGGTRQSSAPPDPIAEREQTPIDSETKLRNSGKATQVAPPYPASTPEKRFKIALSFPGKHRSSVEQVASHLASVVGRDRVLYDKYHEAEFSRPDLDTYLQRLYHDESELIVAFLCADYETSEWCGLEWRAIRDLIKKKQASDVMLFRFDATEVVGLFSIDGYISVEERPVKEIAALIVERLALNGKP